MKADKWICGLCSGETLEKDQICVKCRKGHTTVEGNTSKSWVKERVEKNG
ncbi:MAG: hypothetical protein KKD39_02620 [Candidatus Altiarchaeota archaeon]|nr:hypothetical protein [Candidatus Altiarchaeota archaeon]